MVKLVRQIVLGVSKWVLLYVIVCFDNNIRFFQGKVRCS